MKNRHDKYHLRQERKKTATILFLNLVIASVLIAGIFIPVKRKNQAIKEKIGRDSKRIHEIRSRHFRSTLQNNTDRVDRKLEHLEQQWEMIRSKADSFNKNPELDRAVSMLIKGRIDFKIAFYEARKALIETASEKEIGLPPDLGLAESIASNENARIRIMQLSAIVEIMNALFANNVDAVYEIYPLLPVQHNAAENYESIAYEQPVMISFKMCYNDLTRLIDYSLSTNTFLAWRAIEINKDSKKSDDPLDVTAIVSTITFNMDPIPSITDLKSGEQP